MLSIHFKPIQKPWGRLLAVLLYAMTAAAHAQTPVPVRLGGLGPESVAIANGRKELKCKVSEVGPWSLSFPAYVNVAKDAAEGTLRAQTFIVE